MTLHEVAATLGLSYSTVFERRREIGFRLPGSRVWRVWPSSLVELGKRQYNVTRLVLRPDKETSCQSDSVTVSGGSIYARQAAKELDALLGQKAGRQRRNTTTA